MNNEIQSNRNYWIDNAKAIGIIAVFYGHIVENIFLHYNPISHIQLKLIYSFHIPLFFVLSGYFSHVPDSNFRKYLTIKFVKRIIPVISFNLLIVPIYLLDMIIKNKINILALLLPLLQLLGGYPILNFVTWFLVCLFTVEIIQYFIAPICYSHKYKMIIGVITFYMIGWIIPWKREIISSYTQIGNSWFLYQAIMAYSFYLFGKILSETNLFSERVYKNYGILLFILSTAIFLVTFNINNDLLQVIPQKIVLISAAVYGDILLFPLSAISGSISIIFLSKMIGRRSILRYIGENTLVLMGLNGLFFHFINRMVIDQFRLFIIGGQLSVFIFCGIFSVVSILICFPLIYLLNKYLPLISGKYRTKSPIIPNFVNSIP